MTQDIFKILAPEKFTFDESSWFSSSYSNVTPGTQIVIDFTNCKYIDSSGLGMLLVCKDRLSKTETHIVLSHVTGAVKDIFSIANFHTIFHIQN